MKKYLTILIYTIIYLNTNGQDVINRPIPNSNFLEYKKLFKLGYNNDISTLIIRTMAFDTSEFLLDKRITSEFYTFTKDTFTNWSRFRQVEIEERLGFKKPRMVADSITDTLAYFRKRKLEIPKEIASIWSTIYNFDISNLSYLDLYVTKYTGNLSDFKDTNSIPQCDILATQILDMVSNSNVSTINIYADHPFKYHFKGFKNLTKIYIEMANGFKIVDTSILNKYSDFIYPKKNKKVDCKDILELTSQNFYLDSLIPMPISFDSCFKQNKVPFEEFKLKVEGFKNLPKGLEYLNIKKMDILDLCFDSLPSNLKCEEYNIYGQIKYFGNILNKAKLNYRCRIVNEFDVDLYFDTYNYGVYDYKIYNEKCWYNLPCLVCTVYYKTDTINFSDQEFYLLMQNKIIRKEEKATHYFYLVPKTDYQIITDIEYGITKKKSEQEYYRELYQKPDSFEYENYLANGNDILLSKDSLLPLSLIKRKNINTIIINFIDSNTLAATKGKNLNNIHELKSDELRVLFINSDVNYIIQNTPRKILRKINYCSFDHYSLAHLNLKNAKKLNVIKVVEIPSNYYESNKSNYNFFQKEFIKKNKAETRVVRLFTSKKRIKILHDFKESIPYYLND